MWPFASMDGGDRPRIITPRVVMRPARLVDYREWAEVREASREFLERWEPSWGNDPLSRGAYRRRVGHYRMIARRGMGLAFHVFVRDAGDGCSEGREALSLAGGLTLNNIRYGVVQSCNVGYWIGAHVARKGYMTEALAGAADFVFDTLGLHRLEAACLPENHRSIGLLEKLGFESEGYAREYLLIDGRWTDHRLFGLIATDWRRRRPLPPAVIDAG
ncbi:GNAT family N-acetyltransferase [Tistrella mobilis]|uniref:GCN5-related N-acetyltransferase n=1 Tax=Tistrella mobilis (strain KA081020-065) TaxID=1110502 RepID=I3TPF1_TISMK|nr:GNAT family protein [Tistrella mobilis]AFK54639.1 GCN5-related N-acetyltransferase [Tistrella mobilis KA081020-065]